MFDFLFAAAPRARSAARSASLQVEALEDRCVPATTIRPIEDFLGQQGTYLSPDIPGGVFVPPVKNHLAWTDPGQGLGMEFDYAGLANQALIEEGGQDLGTTFSGKVIERDLPDGRAEVTVLLHTKNALSWAIPFDFSDPGDNPFGDNDLLFGARVTDVLNGATPALGQSFLQTRFIVTGPGAPLPDLLQIAFAPNEGEELVFLGCRGQASGELRDDFGVPDGTPGRVNMVQTGLFMTHFQGATADGFPAERINITPVGRGAAAAPDHSIEQAYLLAVAEVLGTAPGKKRW
jgi:hypothetical protein